LKEGKASSFLKAIRWRWLEEKWWQEWEKGLQQEEEEEE